MIAKFVLPEARWLSLTCVSCFILAVEAAQPLVFRTPPCFPTGSGPAQIVVADFNRDGKLDAATANFNDGTVSILLGTPGAALGPARHIPVGAGTDSLAVGDFNGDGNPDIAAVNGNGWNQPGMLSVLLGRGDGTFEPPASLALDRGPRGVVAADFDGDGNLDLAVAISGGWFETNQVNVLLGKGDGSFGAPATFSVGLAPSWITSADFNGDGRPDLAVVNAGPGSSGHTISVLLNDGGGSFGTASTYAVGVYPGFIATGDFNKDGKPDLIAANRASSSISLLLGRGDGSFDPAKDYAVGSGAAQLGIKDFDNDGNLDLAVLGGTYDAGTVAVFLGDGSGSLKLATTPSIGVGLNAIAVGDLAGNSSPDLLVAGGYDNSLLLLEGNGDGSFKSATDTYPVTGTINSIIAIDLNKDGHIDIVTANPSSDSINVVLQETNGGFRSSATYATGSQPRAVKAGDFNNDGFMDLVVANFDGSLTLLRGRTTSPGDLTNDWNNGFLGTAAIGSNHTDVAVGYFNSDSHLDVVTPNYYGASLSVALGDGTGRFQEPLPPAIPVNSGPTSVVVEDFNGDGKADIAAGYDSGFKISIAAGRGDGTFDSKVDISTWEIPICIVTADVNFDGKPDLIAAHYDWRRISVMLNRTPVGGPLQFDPPLMHDVANDPLTVAVGDFNGDNLPDIVSGNFASVSVLLGNGDGTFLTATNFFVGGKYAAVADFNGDGMHDIAIDLGSKVGLFWNDTLPRLEISRAEGGVRIAWPAWNRYALEATTNALANSVWTTVEAMPAVFGNQFAITNRIQDPSQSYRLKRL